MCPSFMATRDEKDSTRGRANALRDVLARGTLDRPDLASKDVYDVLDLCLSCKACKTECPSSVDMAKLKTEFLAHYQAEHGASLRSRVFGHIHDLSRLASPVAPFVNLGMRLGLDAPVKKALGVAPERSLSPFAARTFTDHWRRPSAAPWGKAASDARQGRLFPRHLHRVQLPAYRHGGGEAAGSGRVRGHRREAPRLLRPPDALQGTCRRGSQAGAAQRGGAGALRSAGHSDCRHRAELHPDPARRVSRSCSPTTQTSRRSPARPT